MTVMRVLVAFGCLVSSMRAEDIEWFKSQYLPAAEKLERAYDHCVATVTTTVTNDKNGDRVQTTYKFAFEGENTKFDREMEIHNAGGTRSWKRTLVGTPTLTFMVLTRDGKTLLEQVDRSARGLAFATETIDGQAGNLRVAFALQGWPISKWLSDKKFAVKSIRKEGESVRMDFKASRAEMTYEGWLEFLPNRQWVIDRWEIQLTKDRQPPDTWRRSGEAHYGGEDGVPRVESVKQLIFQPDRTETEISTVSGLDFGPVPDSRFMLSHYGFDNRIATQAAGGGALWKWMAAGGGILLATALVLRLFMRRAAA